MKRKKKPTTKSHLSDEKKKIQRIINNISSDWNGEERETSILFEHYYKVVHLETSHPATARRWFKNLWGNPDVKFSTKTDSLKITVPWEYCRQPDLIVKAKYRESGVKEENKNPYEGKETGRSFGI